MGIENSAVGGVQQQSGGGGIADFSFSEGSGDGQMGKLEFLELLTAQLKHQDPMAPADDKAFIAQLAQFSALEQQMKGNDMLSRIEMAQGAMLTSQATGLIGKEVTAEGDQIFVDPNAPPPPIRFSVDDNAAKVRVEIKNQLGETVRTLQFGTTPEGAHSFTWDGKDDDGNQLPEVMYRISVRAADINDRMINTNTVVTGRVDGVTFEKGFPELLVGDSKILPANVMEILYKDSGNSDE